MALHYFKILYNKRNKSKYLKKQSYINWVARGAKWHLRFWEKIVCTTFICNYKKTKQIILQKQYFAFRISTVCHVWNSILQPLALIASTTTTILTRLPSDYGE